MNDHKIKILIESIQNKSIDALIVFNDTDGFNFFFQFLNILMI